MLNIREETISDHNALRRVLQEAFGRDEEANLVAILRANGKIRLSLVAEIENQLAGHILFSPVTIEGIESTPSGLGLAPLAVLPGFQRLGIGAGLVVAGIERLRTENCPWVAVLGHPTYYPKFGFVPASRYGLQCEYGVPDEVFMVLELAEGMLRGHSGTVKYQPEFSMF